MTEQIVPSPPALWLDPRKGLIVDVGGKPGKIVSALSLEVVVVEDLATKETTRIELGQLKIWTEGPPEEAPVAPDLASIPPERLAMGLKRLKVIQEILAVSRPPRSVVEEYAAQLEISTPHLYDLVSKWRRQGGVTGLIPHVSPRKKSPSRLVPAVAQIVESAIDEYYLKRREPLKTVVAAVKNACLLAGETPPSPTTVSKRIKARPPSEVAAARLLPGVTNKVYKEVYGPGEEPQWPLHRVQIDHTVADLFIIDPEQHQALMRPFLTLVFDEYSRCILGFRLSLSPPSTLSVAMALHHAVFPKAEYCRRMGIETPWEMYGKPDSLFTDNAAEFDSAGLILGCQHYDINHTFRPLDKPEYGGRIERFIGTLMGRLTLIPGATGNNIRERGKGYDPEKHAIYTLEEAERRVAHMIAIYHREVHSSLKVEPRQRWKEGIVGNDAIPGRGLPAYPTDPERFLIDFLPAARRTLQEYGVMINCFKYNWPVLRILRDRYRKEQVIVRHNPDDVSRIWVWDRENFRYYEVPMASGRSTPAPLWEVNRAMASLKKEGYDAENEAFIFNKLEQLRREDEEQAAKVKQARKAIARRKEAEQTSKMLPAPAKRTVPALPSSASIDQEVPPTFASEPTSDSRPKQRPVIDVESW